MSVHIYFNNDTKAHAPKDAIKLKKQKLLPKKPPRRQQKKKLQTQVVRKKIVEFLRKAPVPTEEEVPAAVVEVPAVAAEALVLQQGIRKARRVQVKVQQDQPVVHLLQLL